MDNPRAGDARRREAVLVIDDDLGTCEMFVWALSSFGYSVSSAATGVEGIGAARRGRMQVAYVDLRLPDLSGTSVIQALREEVPNCRLILMSAYLTVEVVTEAMSLGALDVLEKPLDALELPDLVRAALEGRRAHRAASGLRTVESSRSDSGTQSPRSVAERWARYVLGACQADGDCRTVPKWARAVGVSRSSLAETSRLLGIRPREARDLMRLLRALIQARRHGCSPQVFLDVSDSRTLRALLTKGGLASGVKTESLVLSEFLLLQRFVDPANEGLRVLMRLLSEASVGKN
ncbi:MAG: response regulator [Vicinamibacterales bacterium]